MTLTAGELAYMREELSLALPDTAVIQSVGRASDGMGGGTETWTASGTVSCRVAPRQSTRGSEAGRADAQAAVNDWIITLPHGSTVTETNRVVTGGVTYEITRCRSPRSWQLDMRVEAVKVV